MGLSTTARGNNVPNTFFKVLSITEFADYLTLSKSYNVVYEGDDLTLFQVIDEHGEQFSAVQGAGGETIITQGGVAE